MPDNDGGWQDVQQDEGWKDVAPVAKPDAFTQQSKAAAIAAGVQNPGVSTPPLKAPMEAAGAYEQDRERRLGEAMHRASQSPTPFTNAASVLYPAAQLPEAIASGGLKTVGKAIARGLGKSVGGAAIGGATGAGIGEIVGHPKEGAEIGATVGGVGGPFAPDAWFERAPYGLNRMILGEEGLANARSASKIAQRNADIAAGLRKPPAGPEPSMIAGTSTSPEAVAEIPQSALPAIAKGAMPEAGAITTTGSVQPNFLREIPRQGLSRPGSEGEGPIGSNPIERRIQTTASKAIVTPEEYAQSVRDLGSRARMLPGEGEAEWRARVTGLLKAARARTD